MWVDRKPFIYIWRPIYRVAIAGFVWPLMSRMKRSAGAVEFQEIRRELSAINSRLDAIQTENERRWSAIETLLTSALEARLSARESETSRQWNGMEALILSILSESVSREHRIE